MKNLIKNKFNVFVETFYLERRLWFGLPSIVDVFVDDFELVENSKFNNDRAGNDVRRNEYEFRFSARISSKLRRCGKTFVDREYRDRDRYHELRLLNFQNIYEPCFPCFPVEKRGRPDTANGPFRFSKSLHAAPSKNFFKNNFRRRPLKWNKQISYRFLFSCKCIYVC